MIELCTTAILGLFVIIFWRYSVLQSLGAPAGFAAKISILACFFKPFLAWNPSNWRGFSLLLILEMLIFPAQHKIEGPFRVFDLILRVALCYMYVALVEALPRIYILLTFFLEEPHCAAYCQDLISKFTRFSAKLAHLLCSLNRPLFH